MNRPDAVDAKIARARLQLRRLRTDIAELCSELARLIVPEEREGHHHWVYRGTEPRLPLDWSVRAGEYARNLRSALDRMVWQLAAVRGQCAGRRGGGIEWPGRHNRFPVE